MVPNDNKAVQLSRRIRDIYSRLFVVEPKTTQDVVRQELQAMFDVCLGEGYPKSKVDAVAELQRSLREQKQALVSQLEHGEIKADHFTTELKRLLSDIALRCEAILGPHDYVQLFGVEAKDAADLIDPPIG